ncbi:MAG: chromosome segregation protein SMC [Anaerolineae bacterium]
MPLRLKSLELQGYKTFASRTLFEFASGITAIVGPNGSGKSNIADALRWVLGEQSYSLLRGKKTEDMIFAGSEHRPRAGMAQATILFDNSENWLPVDFSEVALERRAYRDGRNEYLLNGQHVRLREINEMLAQAGLSERTYTILGQGLVDASLALKAEERRRLFEEAAGVGLYRSRREEALKRLETTERNLERVLDILAELEPRLRHLERQAKRAQEYAQAQADLKVILREWYGYHWHRAQRDLAEMRETVRQQETRLRQAREAYQQAQAAYLSFRNRLSSLRSEINAWHRQSAQLHHQREAISRQLAVLEERQRSLLASQQTMLAEQQRIADEIQAAGERLNEANQEVEKLQAEYEEAKSQLSAAQQSLQQRQNERTALEKQLSSLRSQLDALNRQRTQTQARLDEIKERLAAQAQKQETLQQVIVSAETTARKAEEQARAARQRREQAEAALRQAESALEEKKKSLTRLEAERRAALDERATRQAEFSRLQAQREVLEQAEQSLAGYAEGARFLLQAARQSRLKGARGALSSAIEVPAELETAITAALGDGLDAVLLDSGEVETALQLLEDDEAGRAALLPLEALSNEMPFSPPDDPAVLGLAARLVEVPAELRHAIDVLLGHTIIVRDRAAAKRLLRELPPQARLVTLRGEVFRGDGMILAGKTASASTLSRPRQKRELDSALSALRVRLEEANRQVEHLSQELAAAQRALVESEAQLRRERQGVEEAQKAEQQAGLESESARRQLEWQKKQLEQIQAEAQEAAVLRQKLIQSQTEAQERASQTHAQLRALSANLAELALDELQGQVAYWTTRLAVAEQGLNGARTTRNERTSLLNALQKRQADLTQRLENTALSLQQLESEKVTLHEREKSLQAQIEEVRAQIEPAEKDLESAEQEDARLQEAEAQAQRALSSVERLFGQVQLDQTRRQEALETLRQKIMDDFGLVMFEYAAEVSGPVPLPLDGMVEQLPVVTELAPDLEQQLTQQRAQLRRMGPINPEARQEYERESERYSFLQAQVEDLRKAEADLKQVIAELDELTRQEFSRVFDAVDREFRQIFVRLFGGGSARLALTDPDNLVETGIEIEARLPGRREQGLALLSGGERSLTAIALVFALLKVSPTPVCVMDEVDAMLDEANVGRFRDLLMELSKDTQFIIITHNRNTVQAADVIYGITMGRDSASQVISLRLDQVTDEMLARG